MALALNTPLAEALNNRIQPKLVEIGWSVGDDNSPLGEYICLMMVNGKSQEQIASELSGDLLGLDPDDASAAQFARWLFDELESLKKTAVTEGAPENGITSADEEMHDTEEGLNEIPTAPKAMRQPNPRRLMNQLTKAMERNPQEALHRVRIQQSERVEKFKRDPPKGPSRPNGMRHNNQSNRHNINRMNGRPFGPNQNMLPNMTPQQQMAFYQMYQQQSHMIAPFMQPVPSPAFQGPARRSRNNNMQMPMQMPMPMPLPMPMPVPMPMSMPMDDAYSNNLSQPQRAGGSLFDRIQSPPDLGKGTGSMDTSEDVVDVREKSEKPEKPEKPEELPCKFGPSCTKPECPFGHPTPAAITASLYVSGEKCPFGTGCRNRKCTGSHPSPASAPVFSARPKQVDQDCKFFPNCTNTACPFKHPAMPMCRNGANCTRPDCHFTHAETACKFKPCLNPSCIYKHEAGQQQTAPPSDGSKFGNKVWTAPGMNRYEHVSERRFVGVESDVEELIIPGQARAEFSGDMDTATLDIE